MIAKNTIHNMDCMEGMKELPDESIDMILTDPPYGIDYFSNHTDHQKRIANDDKEGFQDNFRTWVREFKRLIKPQGIVAIFIGGGGRIPVAQQATLIAIEEGLQLVRSLVWDKKTIGIGYHYRPSYETILILAKDSDDYAWFAKTNDVSDIQRFNNVIPQKGDHPTPKPIPLLRVLIELHTVENETILDPFMGGGSTAVACKQLGRDFIGFELDKGYADYANKRLQKYNSARFFT